MDPWPWKTRTCSSQDISIERKNSKVREKAVWGVSPESYKEDVKAGIAEGAGK